MTRQYAGGVIDLRLHQPATRLALVEQVLNVLLLGDDVLFVLHEKPLRLPTYIHERFPGQFTLSFIDQGPEIWSVCLTRVDRAVSGDDAPSAPVT